MRTRRVIKIAGGASALLVLCVAAAAWYFARPVISFDENAIPRDLITAQFIDIDRIYAISQFRSGAGHDYSHGAWNGETCRSMKHYFNLGRYQSGGRPVRSIPTATEPNITIYAPFDGRITSASSEHLGTQVHIRSARYPSYTARIFHTDLLPGLRVGSTVTSGQLIGTIGPKDGTDFALEANAFPTGRTIYISYFAAMTDEVFAPFAQKGFRREDFIISKAYRDAHPFTCGGMQTNPLNRAEETFHHSGQRSWMEDFVFLAPDPSATPGQQAVHVGPPPR